MSTINWYNYQRTTTPAVQPVQYSGGFGQGPIYRDLYTNNLLPSNAVATPARTTLTPTFSYQRAMQDIMSKYQASMNEARTANEDRYNQLLGLNSAAGDQATQDINRQYSNLQAQQGQSLASRGLAGTTILPTVQAGVERNRSAALASEQERLRQERMGIIERRNDTYPELSYYGAMMQALGAGGANLFG